MFMQAFIKTLLFVSLLVITRILWIEITFKVYLRLVMLQKRPEGWMKKR